MTAVRATPAEVAALMPGDDIIAAPVVVMDRGFSLPVPAEQLGKGLRERLG
jgi:hypothetical protein